MLNDWIKEQLSSEKARKQADDQRIFSNLQVYAYICGINIYALSLLKNWKAPEKIGVLLIFISFIYWFIAILLWRKAFFGYKYEHEAPIENIRNREQELKTHYSNHFINDPTKVESWTKKTLEKEIVKGIERVQNSYNKNNKTRTELFSESNRKVFISFIFSLAAAFFLKIFEMVNTLK